MKAQGPVNSGRIQGRMRRFLPIIYTHFHYTRKSGCCQVEKPMKMKTPYFLLFLMMRAARAHLKHNLFFSLGGRPPSTSCRYRFRSGMTGSSSEIISDIFNHTVFFGGLSAEMVFFLLWITVKT